jgi:hypothetical protein
MSEAPAPPEAPAEAKPAAAAPPAPADAKPAAPAPQAKPADKEEAADDSAKEAPSTVEAKVDPDAREEKLFEQKAILYRFDKDAGDWKERGLGFLKILKDPDTARCRILMRRAQTFRVCANHFILPGMTLKATGDRTVIWHATDFADGKTSTDVLSAKFKGPDVAAEFKAKFELARKQNEALGASGGEAADA